VPDGTAGLAAFESAAPPYHLLLADLAMPGPLNGKALADEIVRRWPAIKVVFVLGFAESTLSRDDAPAISVLLSKPFRKRDVALVIHQALDGDAGPNMCCPRRPRPDAELADPAPAAMYDTCLMRSRSF
jgi:CheY-like chemotaxis protein